MDAFLVGIAALAGILVGFWLRGIDARAEIGSMDQRNRDMTDALARTRGELEKAAADTSARAGFESLAGERERTIGQMSVEQERLRAELQSKTEAEKTHAARVGELEADLRNERERTSGSLAVLDNAKQALASQFENLVAEVMAKKSASFSGDNQGELSNLLSPLREQLNEFREKVEQAQLDSNTGVTKLESLIGTLGGLNQQLAQEARNLSTALRGSAKAQGDWGEIILRDLLEKAGLREGDQFTLQQSFRDVASEGGWDSGSKQTDVIVHLPGGRHLVIDSKVPLTAYLDSVNAELEDDRAASAREHLKLVRNHIASVAQANYHGLPGIQMPDFVMMFVPIEPALLEALKGDSDVWADAYAKGVLLAGPTTLLYVIRIVSILWRQEDHNRIVKELTDHGSALHAKFTEFVGDMDGLGESLHNASARYAEAKKKLSDGRNNLFDQFEEFKQLSSQPKLTQPAEPMSFKWAAPATENPGLSSDSEDESQRLEVPEVNAETNGYHHELAQELELEEARSSAS
jgi:DNA recombination protein RmuC